jgi:hypothetical protein
MRAIYSLFVLFIGISLIVIGVSAKDSTVVTSGISSGMKTIEKIPVISDFPAVTSPPTKPVIIKTDISGPLTVSDLTGLGDGWRLGIWATQFTEDKGSGSMSLPKGSLILSFPETMIGKAGVTPPYINSDQPWILDGDMPITIVKADTNIGAGNYQLNFPDDALSLTLNPGTTSKTPATYKTVITWMLIAGP